MHRNISSTLHNSHAQHNSCCRDTAEDSPPFIPPRGMAARLRGECQSSTKRLASWTHGACAEHTGSTSILVDRPGHEQETRLDRRQENINIIQSVPIMGINQLNTFLAQSHPSSFCSTVDVATLARQYRADTGREPEIVVDANNVMYTIYSKYKFDWLMGGQLKECIAEIENFINAFVNIGVHLIFYFDGATPSVRRDKWVKRRTQRLDDIGKVFNHLKRRAHNTPSRTDLSKVAVQPPLVGATSRYMVKYACADRAGVRIACEDGDLETAAFAKQNRCLAVLTDDTDFAVLGRGLYLSSRRLNVNTMTTRLFDGHKLAEHFSLRFEQLPLFASLLGNDILPVANLKEFHKGLTNVVPKYHSNGYQEHSQQSLRNLFQLVADFVRTTPEGQPLVDMLPHIAQTQLHDVQILGLLRESVAYYSMATVGVDEAQTEYPVGDKQWQTILNILLNKHRNSEVPCIIRNIMTGKQFESTTSLEDLANHDLPSAALAFKTLRRRTYGILLWEKPGGSATVEEWCIYGMRDLSFEYVDIIPVHASTVHPGLLALMTDYTSPDVRDQRWRLFITTMSVRLDSALVGQLPARLLVPTCVLFYIQHHAAGTPLLSDWELAAFLVTAVEMASSTVDSLRRLTYNREPPPRAVDVANLFARGVSVTHVLLAACGYNLEQFMPWHFYDGKLFLENYRLMGNGRRQIDIRHSHSPSQVQEFEMMKRICQ